MGAVAGAWDLLQLPTEGHLICPTLTPVQAWPPSSYYAPFAKHVKSDQAVRQLSHRRGELCGIKMGLSATQTTGRMGYLRRVGRVTTLIVRLFQSLPGEPYVDLPRASDALFRRGRFAGLQRRERAGELWRDGVPRPGCAVVGREPHTRGGDVATHVLAGPDAAVRKAGGLLLGVKM